MAFYNTVFISDLHLGTDIAQTQKLLDFLDNNEFNNLYLLGDIIDIQQMKQKLFWEKSHNKVIQKILKLSKYINVKYIFGNHDDFLKLFKNESFGNIEILEREVYTTANNKQYLLLHGHQFDGIISNMKWLYWLGDNAYCFSLWLNKWVNKFRTKILKKEYWSLSQFLKTKVKNAVKYINNFEKLIVKEANKYNVDGVICGHIHVANDTYYSNTHYLNCGCFTEFTTCITENENGEMNLKYL